MKKPLAVFTYACNDPFLPVWIEFYSKLIPLSDIYVIEETNNRKESYTDILSLSMPKGNILWTHGCNAFNFEKTLAIVQAKQRELLNSYELVLYTDADEIVWSPLGFDHYVNQTQTSLFRCNGHEIVQNLDYSDSVCGQAYVPEPAIDLRKPIMGQRKYWYPCGMYSKPVLARIPVKWWAGFHNTYDYGHVKPDIDPDLYLIHLKRIDFDICLSRQKQRSKSRYEWEGKQEGKTVGEWHNWFESKYDEGWEREWLRSVWMKSIDGHPNNPPANLVEIPDYVRNVIPL